jgi:hypothetical protein
VDWRRVLLWLGLAAVLAGSVALIARVSMIAFGGLQRNEATRAGAPSPSGAAGAPADRPKP